MATMERIVLALGAKGLVNAQFIVRDDGVYLIEVNPRASRTVPFLSKVTGVPMVELAVRISLGATLEELGDVTAFVCGSTGFCNTAGDLLVAIGQPVDRIKVERFGPSG